MELRPWSSSELRSAGGPTRVGVKASGYPNALDYVGYSAMHLACLGAFWTGVSRTDLVLFFVSYVVRMFGLVAGYHRYFSHKAFKATRGMQFALGLLGTLTGQKGVLWWAAHHRFHHRYSDTPRDVHSPVTRSFLYSHSGWFLDKSNRDTDYTLVTDLVKYPELVWLNKWNVVIVTAYAVGIFAFFGWSGLVWGFFISTVLLWHAVHGIGSFGHRFGGYRRFATPDNSRNKWFLGLVMLGEGWHNNHHYFPASARQGMVWWEIDIAYYVLRLLHRLGRVTYLNLPPAYDEVQKSGMQKHMQRFKQWLVDLRMSLEQQLDAFGRELGLRDEARLLQLAQCKQAIQEHLDLFDDTVSAQVLHDPEQLKHTYAALERGIIAEIARLTGELQCGVDAAARLPQAVKAELRTRVVRAPFGHLFVDTAVYADLASETARTASLPLGS